VLAVRRFPRSQVGRYGVVAIDGSEGRLHTVTDMVEKTGTWDGALGPRDHRALRAHPSGFRRAQPLGARTGQEIQLTGRGQADARNAPRGRSRVRGGLLRHRDRAGLPARQPHAGLKREGLREELAPLLRELLDAD